MTAPEVPTVVEREAVDREARVERALRLLAGDPVGDFERQARRLAGTVERRP